MVPSGGGRRWLSESQAALGCAAERRSVRRRSNRLTRKSTQPIGGPSPIMRNREDLQPVRQFDVDDVVREPANENPTDILVRNSGRSRSDARVLFDPGYRCINSREKLSAEFEPMPLIPTRGFRRLGVCLLADPKRQLQRLPSPSLIRRRTSGHGFPGSSPERARAARRSISAAHAASASPSRAPSKLASNSAASSARSGRPSFRASSSSFSPTFLTETRLSRGAPSNKPKLSAAGFSRAGGFGRHASW